MCAWETLLYLALRRLSIFCATYREAPGNGVRHGRSQMLTLRRKKTRHGKLWRTVDKGQTIKVSMF